MLIEKAHAIGFARGVNSKYNSNAVFGLTGHIQLNDFAMSKLMDNVKTINSAVRTCLVLGACGVVAYGGYFGYNNYVKPSAEAKQAIADLAELKEEYEKQTVLLERLETSMKLLKVDRRIANVTVLEKGEDEEGDLYMEVSFTEVDENDEPVGATRNFTLKGEKFYIDGWIATFEDNYIENADELRAASMFVFKSIYGDAERPKDAQRLDIKSNENAPPGIYNDHQKREFEQKIWGDFWKVCNDADLQRELGIRASQGQTSYMKPEEGKTYQVNIRASGGMTLKPIVEP